MTNQVEVEIDLGATNVSPAMAGTVRKAIQTVLAQEGFASGNPVSVTVLLTGDERLRSLNREFAGEDHITDVLSFPANSNAEFQVPHDDSYVNQIGDIAISIPQTERQAIEKGMPFKRELAMLAIHGTLHLLGYDHAFPEEERVMFGKTDDALIEMFDTGA